MKSGPTAARIRQPHAVFDRPAPPVRAAVGTRAQELVEQIAFAAHDFHAVVAGLLREPGAAHVGGNRRFDAGLGKRLGLEARDRRLQVRRRHDERLVAVAPCVQDLQHDLAAFFVHGARDAPVVRHVANKIERAAKRQQPALAVG